MSARRPLRAAVRASLSRLDEFRLFLSRTMQAVLAGELAGALLAASWWVAFITCFALATSFLPAILERNTRLHTPASAQLVITVFIFATLFLGEVQEFYVRFWWWDMLLHAGSGVILGLVGFLILFTLFDYDRVRMHPVLLSTFAVSFAMAMGTIWEIFEFAVDQTLDLNMQRQDLSDGSGVVDTMSDMILNATTAIIVVAIAHAVVSQRRGRRWFREWADQFVDPMAPQQPAPRVKRVRMPAGVAQRDA